MKTLAWREYNVNHPGLAGLGSSPELFDDGAWYVRQSTGVGSRVMKYSLGLGDIASAATAMNDALMAHGYKQSDMGLYKAFQQSAGLTADGFPGSSTMQALSDQLIANGQLLAPVSIYPWLATGQYDGVNAPLLIEWYAPATTPNTPQRLPTLVITGNPTQRLTGNPTPNYTAWIIGGVAAAGVGVIGYAYWRKKHRRR
jgi:hypothetical protein